MPAKAFAAASLALALAAPGWARAEGPETYPAAEEAATGLLFGSNQLQVQFHGFLNAEYAGFAPENGAPPSTFDLHNADLSARASIGSSVTLFVEVEYEHGAQLRIDRANVEWALLPFLSLRAGRFYSPLSYERTHYYAPVRLLTSRPLTADIAFHEWADTGVALFGRHGMVGFEAAVVNGPAALTERGVALPDVRDNNADKTAVGRLALFPRAGVEAGIAGATGAYDPAGRRRFQLAEADLRVQTDRLEVWAEFDRRWGDDEPCGATPDPACPAVYTGERAAKQGFYLLTAYSVLLERPAARYLKTVLRYDQVEAIGAGGTRRLTAGLNWSPVPHLLVRGEYQWTRPFGLSGPGRDGPLASLVADF